MYVIHQKIGTAAWNISVEVVEMGNCQSIYPLHFCLNALHVSDSYDLSVTELLSNYCDEQPDIKTTICIQQQEAKREWSKKKSSNS